ncbi:cytochrome C [Arcobacter sp. LA11]|uniref:cytochrome C n=1 Tax=Arcobacter sp. LA11 TaxID=1898176 RepID=UPI001575FBC8|nr:cytochrome C [Arcobacter sp. LA11]
MKKLLILLILLFNNIYASNYGELLFYGNCVTCHFKTKKVSAPSIAEVKENYINAFPIEEDFVNYMTQWVLKPNAETSIMKYSIDEFELMPELGYDKLALEEIARYIFKTNFNKPPK